MPGTADKRPAPSPRLLGLPIAGVVVAMLISAGVAVNMFGRPDVVDAQTKLAAGDAEGALKLCRNILKNHTDSKPALMIAGEAAVALNRRETALRFFSEIEDDGSPESIEAAVQCGRLAFGLGRLTEAEQFFRRALTRNAAHVAANEYLLEILRLEARNWDAQPSVYQLLRQQRFHSAYLQMAAPRDHKWLHPENDAPFLQQCARSRPGDPIYMLGALREQLNLDHQPRTAKEKLFRIVDLNPDLIEAQATLGQLLLDIEANREFLAWHKQLPASADEHPLIWMNRGRWARRHDNLPAAARCLWEANRLDANDRGANLMMANLLASMGREDEAALFQQRGDDLVALTTLFAWGDDKELDPVDRIEQMIVILEKLGRLWEARGWSEVLSEMQDGKSQFATGAIDRLDQQLNPDVPMTLAQSRPANVIDLSDLPLPTLSSNSERKSAATRTPVSFADVARQVGLDFTYYGIELIFTPSTSQAGELARSTSTKMAGLTFT